MVYTCRWGILATGGIASKFAKDLMEDPAKREVDDVRHEIVAIASSTSKDRAEDFVRRMGIDKAHSREINCYGTYEELVENPEVDIVYVATPHSAHYENCKLALEAGKSVLCEKAFTINEPQAAHLIEIAREKKVFMMEAVWTASSRCVDTCSVFCLKTAFWARFIMLFLTAVFLLIWTTCPQHIGS